MIIDRIPGIAVGPDVAKLPTLFETIPLHSAGVDGYSYRFVASDLGADGAPITSWPARSGTPLEAVRVTGATSAGSPTITTSAAHGFTANQQVVFTTDQAPLVAGVVYYVKDVPTTTTYTVAATSGGAAISITGAGTATAVAANSRPSVLIDSTTGEKMAHFDGTDDKLQLAGFGNLTDLLSLTIVARVNSAAGTNRTLASFNSVTLNRVNTGGVSLGAIGSIPGVTVTGQFAILTSVLESGKQALQANATRVTGTATLANVRLKLAEQAGSYTALDVVEIIGWPYGLSAAESTAVYDAMRARYAALLPA